MNFILELAFEFILELTKSERIPRLIRYPLIIIIVSFYLFLIRLLAYGGIELYSTGKKSFGILFIILAGVMVIFIGKFIFFDLKDKKEARIGLGDEGGK